MCRVGGLIFHPILRNAPRTRPSLLAAGVRGDDISRFLVGIWFAFRIPDGSTPHRLQQTTPYRKTFRGWRPFAENCPQLQTVVVQTIVHTIDPSVAAPDLLEPFSPSDDAMSEGETLWQAILRLYNETEVVEQPNPVDYVLPPDPADSPAGILQRKRKEALAAGQPIVLDRQSYVKRALPEIPILIEQDGAPRACRIGGLTFFPRPSSVFVKGEDLYPRFEGMYFAFRIDRTPRIRTDKCFVSTDRGWSLYGKNNPDFLPTVVALIQYAIDPENNPKPFMEGRAALDLESDSLDGDDGVELLWEAMVRVPREEYSEIQVRCKSETMEIWLAEYVKKVWNDKKMGDEKKHKLVKSCFEGAELLTLVDWNALEEVIKTLPPEYLGLMKEAKKRTYVSACRDDDPEKEILEKDPEIVDYSQTEDFQLALAAVALPVELEVEAKPDADELVILL
jgi:hypothetical protein